MNIKSVYIGTDKRIRMNKGPRSVGLKGIAHIVSCSLLLTTFSTVAQAEALPDGCTDQIHAAVRVAGFLLHPASADGENLRANNAANAAYAGGNIYNNRVFNDPYGNGGPDFAIYPRQEGESIHDWGAAVAWRWDEPVTVDEVRFYIGKGRFGGGAGGGAVWWRNAETGAWNIDPAAPGNPGYRFFDFDRPAPCSQIATLYEKIGRSLTPWAVAPPQLGGVALNRHVFETGGVKIDRLVVMWGGNFAQSNQPYLNEIEVVAHPPGHGAVEDAPFAPPVSAMIFDPLVNMVVPAGQVGRYFPRHTDGFAYHFVVAPERFHFRPWATLSLERGACAGCPACRDEPVPGTATAVADDGGLRHRFDLVGTGLWHLWVRLQTRRNDNTPFEAIIQQDGVEIDRHLFNRESGTLGSIGASRMLWERTEPLTLEPGSAVVRLTTGNGLGNLLVDCFLLTDDPHFIPSESMLPGPPAAATDAEPGAPILLWHRSRFSGYQGASRPTGADRIAPSFSFRLPRGGHAHEMLLVTSRAVEPLTFRAAVELRDASGVPFAGRATVRVVTRMESRYFGWTPQTLFRREQIHLAPGHTVGLWLAIAPGQATPGTYEGRLVLHAGTKELGQAPLSLELTAATLPEDRELLLLLWGDPEHIASFYRLGTTYPAGRHEDLRRVYWEKALSLGWNVFREAFPPWPADESRRRGVRALFIRAGEAGADLRQRLDNLYALGWRPEEIWVEAFDEPSVNSADRWLEIAARVRETAPEAPMFINPGWERNQTPEVFRRWAPYVDVWWPFLGNLNVPELREIMMKSGKPVGFYNERGWTNLNPLRAWSYYRNLPMHTAAHDLHGAGFWAANATYHDPWDDLNTRVDYAKAAIVYPGAAGPVDTINAAAWREGLDALHMIRTLGNADVDVPAEWAAAFLNADGPEAQDTLRDKLFQRFQSLLHE